MSAKRVLSVVLVASAVMLAVGIGPRVTNTARALPPALAGAPAQTGVTVPYSGSLTDEAGQPVADGAYAFTFALYAVESGGEPLWMETQESVAVQGGAFTTLLGSVTPLPKEVLDGGAHWLEAGVRGPGEAGFTALSPRQELSAAAPAAAAGLTAPANGLSCWHTHLHENWIGSYSDYALRIQNTTGNGIEAVTNASGGSAVYVHTGATGANGVFAVSESGRGVFGQSNTGYGVEGSTTAATTSGVYGHNGGSGYGVYGHSASGYGVYGSGGIGVFGMASAGYGVYGHSDSGVGVEAESGGGGRNNTALRVNNTRTSDGMAAYLRNISGFHTAHFYNAGAGGVLYLQNGGTDVNGTGGGEFITAVNEPENDTQFRVTTDGSAYSDGGWKGAADFAELIETEDSYALYEPGDVLVISTRSDRAVTLSSEPYSTLVFGVYSENPGFLGSPHVMAGQLAGEIPVAVVGIVPVKVSAENGPIQRGDLLVTASTPGHAMRAINPPPGTILGKALGTLDQGTGSILVLVTLQ